YAEELDLSALPHEERLKRIYGIRSKYPIIWYLEHREGVLSRSGGRREPMKVEQFISAGKRKAIQPNPAFPKRARFFRISPSREKVGSYKVRKLNALAEWAVAEVMPPFEVDCATAKRKVVAFRAREAYRAVTHGISSTVERRDITTLGGWIEAI